MRSRTAGLVRHVDVEPLAARAGTFLGRSVDLGWGRVYGGQTMAQGMAACQRLVAGRTVHQFNCHFLRGGKVDQDIHFETQELSSGRSFSVVHVRALQESKPILTMTASMQTPEEGLEHQQRSELPTEWRRPEDLRPLEDHFAELGPRLEKVPRRLRALYEQPQPIEIRPAEFVPPWDVTVRPPTRASWVRVRTPLPDDLQVHQRLLTYISDWGMVETSLQAHPTAMWDPEMQLASLSHALQLHRPFRLDEQWLCHAMHSPVASGGRCFILGEFWTEAGMLVASTAQEGLMRRRAPKTSRGQST